MGLVNVGEVSGRGAPAKDHAHLRHPFLVVAVSAMSAVLYQLIRLGASPPGGLPFPGPCDRLRSAGLAIQPQDWFCRPQPWTVRAAGIVASLLVAVGLVLPCAILAASGRRWTSYVPLVAAGVGSPGLLLYGSWGGRLWLDHSTLAWFLNFLVLAAPISAITFSVPRPPRAGRRPRRSALIAASVVVAAGVVGVGVGWGVDVSGALVIGSFGALLGPDRRWWPWTLAPIALLLSTGPSLALMPGPEHLLDWSPFGQVVPLAVIGLVCSAWKPLAALIERRIKAAEGDAFEQRGTDDAAVGPDEDRHSERTRPRRIRLVVVADAVGVGMLVVSLAMFRADPMPIQISGALPTYLGLRLAVDDARAKMDLRSAVAAIDSYATKHGSYTGFDSAAAAALEPALTWRDGAIAADPNGSIPALTMAIVSATASRARIVVLSESGDAFCVQRADDGIRFGRGDAAPDAAGRATAVRQAIANCGELPWTVSAISVPDISTMCEGLDPSGGYLTCRMVQAMIVTTLTQT